MNCDRPKNRPTTTTSASTTPIRIFVPLLGPFGNGRGVSLGTPRFGGSPLTADGVSP